MRDTNVMTNLMHYLLTAAAAFGDGSVTSGGAFFNMEIPLSASKNPFYAFGGYNYKLPMPMLIPGITAQGQIGFL